MKFESIIDKYTLSEYERFVFLEKQLAGHPLTLIKSLMGTDRCYSKAKALLTKAFARPLKQKFETIKQLVNLNFDKDEPYKFISDVKLVVSAFDYLKIDVKTMIQYFVWYRLPKEYQDHLVHITGKTYPTLKDIEDDIYEAVDRIASGICPIETEQTFSEPAS